MEEIYPDIYKEVIRFERRAVSSKNLYLIKDGDHGLMIDTSYREQHSLTHIDQMLRELRIPYGNLDIFITHNHPDHSGLVPEMLERGATVYMNPGEKLTQRSLMNCYMLEKQARKEKLRLMGIAPDLEPDLYETMTGYLNRIKELNHEMDNFDFTPICPGEVLDCGRYHFEVVLLKGHTQGQCGLYDSKSRIFFCGDQIMKEIVPIVGSQQIDMRMLQHYLNSLGEFKHKYADCIFLPCHNDEITDIKKEVNRIVVAYMEKCQIVLEMMQKEEGELTTRMAGVKTYGRSLGAPDFRHFYDCSFIWAKTFTCLDYLYEKGFVTRRVEDGVLYWKKSNANT